MHTHTSARTPVTVTIYTTETHKCIYICRHEEEESYHVCINYILILYITNTFVYSLI